MEAGWKTTSDQAREAIWDWTHSTTLTARLVHSHMTVAIVGVVLLAVALGITLYISRSTQQLAHDTGPAAQASAKVLSGVHRSLNALNGWVAIADKQFVSERHTAWHEDIYPGLAALQEVSERAPESQATRHLAEIRQKLVDVHESQWWVEQLANTPGDLPALYFYRQNMIPIGELFEMATAEFLVSAADDPGLIESDIEIDLARFMNLFLIAHNQMYTYAREPDSENEISVRNSLGSANISFRKMFKKMLGHGPDIVVQAHRMRAMFNSYRLLSVRILREDSSRLGSRARGLLESQTTPLSREVTALLETLSQTQNTELNNHAEHIDQVTRFSIAIMLVLIVIMVGAASILSRRHAISISRPLIALATATRELASGKLTTDLPIIAENELGQLTRSFNAMRASLNRSATELKSANESLENRVEARTIELEVSKELAEVTLESIGDAVITTSAAGTITSMNKLAQKLTGWTIQKAKNCDLSEVFHMIDEVTSEPLDDPANLCLKEGRNISLTNAALLVRPGMENLAISNSAAPIRDRDGDIIGTVLVFRDVTIERKLQNKLSFQASHDALTGLVNRQEFERRLGNALSDAQSEKTEHQLLYLDLDQFKIVNDTCGHIAGDQLLKELCEILSSQLRALDTLARLGGDEFGILLTHCPEEPATRIAENIRSKVEEFRYRWQGKAFTIGVSIGMVSVSDESQSIDEILSFADAACYAAKDAGRNRVHVFHTDDSELSKRQSEMQWSSKITEALDDDRFVLFFQPFQRLGQDLSGIPEHGEILVRMLDENGIIVSPGAFIPAAERYNLMPAIDRWVFEHALESSTRLYGGNSRWNNFHLSINVSGATLGDNGFMQFVRDKLAEYEVPADRICLEITETAAIANLARSCEAMRDLKKLGCKFALDDFGSGLSSFGYLKTMPVDILKIDGRFIRRILEDSADHAMVEALHTVAHKMGLQTVAEFAESIAIVDELRRIGIDYAQGYAVAKPMPLEDLIQNVA
ncbi:MAG TPA: EAL domain-containing protein [Chromatiales bacterium]|nr:EAL domain-containing protein [Chromatiaceae bacterium]HIO54445.1 EAL domain-containing protein [Chromatiales bacterium]